VMYFQPATQSVQAAGGAGAWLAAILLAILVVGCGAWPGPPLGVAGHAEAAFHDQSSSAAPLAAVKATVVDIGAD